MPKITVLMPVYNGAKYLKEAIDSVLSQTFRDFEFLIIDDGSTDSSVEIIKSYNDQRIRLEQNDKNFGLIYSLNKGIDLTKNKYIARMDADDISLPDRLKIQFEFMESHFDIAVSGVYTITIGKVNGHTNKFFTEPEDIKANLLFNTSLEHPSVIIRKEILQKYNLFYNENFKHSEDFDLWERISAQSSLANIPKILLKHRLHNDSISEIHNKIQLANANKIKLRQLNKLGLNLNENEIDLYSRLKAPDINKTIEFINQQEEWLLKIITANQEKNIYKNEALAKVIKNRFYYLCDANTKIGLWILKKYLESPLKKLVSRNSHSLLKLGMKSLIKK
jgi:glycosyltransferase involved in cell wall biosynthesis